LEYLSDKRGALMKEIAAKSNLWPVNLGLRVRVIKGEPVREITRLAFARNYLIELALNSQCDFPSAQGSGSHSPFRLAAEELYMTMLMLKHVLFPKGYALGEAIVCSHSTDDKTQFTGLVAGRKDLPV
jgi:hypothetical protein